MVLVLCDGSSVSAGGDIAAALSRKFGASCPSEVLGVSAIYNHTPEWNDLLIVVYAESQFPTTMQDFIRAFRQAHGTLEEGTSLGGTRGFILPVATNIFQLRPSDPISRVRAIFYDGTVASLDQITDSAGVFLGLALKGRDHRIFISYSASDGKTIATELHRRLDAAGLGVWLDEAKGSMPPGVDVVAEIRNQLRSAALVLVIDTPNAPESEWITEEIDTAIGQLIPIVPVVVGCPVSRFIPLASLQRRVVLQPNYADGQELSDLQWHTIWTEIESVLLAGYCRRLRILSRAEKIFRENQFNWSVVEERMRMYQAERKRLPLPSTIVLSHCSVHEVTYVPALRAYADFVRMFPRISSVNHKLCIYDRERPLSDAEFVQINKVMADIPFELAHYNQLSMLISSNFTKLR